MKVICNQYTDCDLDSCDHKTEHENKDSCCFLCNHNSSSKCVNIRKLKLDKLESDINNNSIEK